MYVLLPGRILVHGHLYQTWLAFGRESLYCCFGGSGSPLLLCHGATCHSGPNSLKGLLLYCRPTCWISDLVSQDETNKTSTCECIVVVKRAESWPWFMYLADLPFPSPLYPPPPPQGFVIGHSLLPFLFFFCEFQSLMCCPINSLIQPLSKGTKR